MNNAAAQSKAKSKRKNQIFIVLVVISNAFGNLLLGAGVKQMPDYQHVSTFTYALTLFTNLWIVAGILLLIVWMVAQLSMFTWADLTYVLPVTASGYILTAILSKFLLNETISYARWAGIALISLGVVFVTDTPPRAEPSLKAGVE